MRGLLPVPAHPTPIRDGAGNLIGAVNMLFALTDPERAKEARNHLSAIGRSVTMLIPDDHQDEEPRILERIRRRETYETVLGRLPA
ncbi:hypothetical protein NKI31_23870 [Mesorhizobium sp. M0659]|uniref:hypothetical protein n=1 Tax=Mesorhizobium sp. M0659 TaxID=2956980 RepID=UPI003339936E